MRIEKRLFGNGQKGELDKQDDRIAGLETTKNRLLGAIGIISFLLTLTGGTLLAHLLGHH
jgi:hypothetical protein